MSENNLPPLPDDQEPVLGFQDKQSGENLRPPADNTLSGKFEVKPTKDVEPSITQIDCYRIIRKLGTGGFAVVYLAEDENLQRKVSIKIPHRHRFRTAIQRARYLQEARLVAKLDHPKIVPVYSFGELPDGVCYVVSKFIECETLAERISASISPVEAIRTVIDLAETLQFIHDSNIVHRDIKPTNILISRNGQYFINDFGLAMTDVIEAEKGMIIGTPSYMSPEQASGEGHLVTRQSDIFSLGVILYELLTGRKPFRGGSPEQIIYQIRNLDPKPLRQMNDSLPIALERVCQKALAKQTGRRYLSAMEFAEDLLRILEQCDSTELKNGILEESRRPIRNNAPDSTVSSPSNDVDNESLSATSTEEPRVLIIPKGLRSYDQSDAAFFKSMLPGPYDIDGCPESIRFWIKRINPTRTFNAIPGRKAESVQQAIEPFRVGVIFGTSGCGKSSFVRAGVLPLLDEAIRVCVIDATARGTLARLDQLLARKVPTFTGISVIESPLNETRLADDLRCIGYTESFSGELFHSPGNLDRNGESNSIPLDRRLASIRRGENLAANEKVLIIIDQFEQFLNSADAEENATLIRALRQCDGHHLQTILLVRDDFWLATSRLMKEIDIELSATNNFAMIDLLDKPHAGRLLQMLGRAYGRLGDEGTRIRREQRQFIRDAIDDLSTGTKVVAVHLALFAEMMKSRPWTRATLRSIRGLDRVVEQFLIESFDVASAPKNQRLHQDAARRLLGAMLPETGLIRGKSVSMSMLAAAAGYPEKSDSMAELIRILDGQLKLITAIEADNVPDSSSSSPNLQGLEETRFQLTHDSLIPAIRRWLTKHQEKSFHGRAKKAMKERCIAWSEGRDVRQLPSFFQWVQLQTLVSKRDRTLEEQQMMSIATAKHGRTILLSGTLAMLSFIGWKYFQSHSEADRMVGQLTIATTEELPKMLGKMDLQSGFVVPKLHEKAIDETESEHVRFLATLALPNSLQSDDLRFDPIDVANYLLKAKLDMLELAVQHRPDWIPKLESILSSVINNPKEAQEKRLKAGLILAMSEPSSAKESTQDSPDLVKNHLEFLADAIVEESLSNKLGYKSLLALAKPIRKALAPEFVALSWDSDQSEKQAAAVALLRDLNVDHPLDLVDAALDLSHKEFQSIIAKIDIQSLSIDDLEKTFTSHTLPSRLPSRRNGLAAALTAIVRTSNKNGLLDPNKKWAEKMVSIIDNEKKSVGIGTMLHSLVPLGFSIERIFDSVFESNADRRRFQLLLMGEAIANSPNTDSIFKNQCKLLARDRLQTDPDTGVFSAARWLLVRLEDNEWLEEQLEKRIQKVAPARNNSSVNSRLRINSQKMPMVRFNSHTIAATSETDSALPDTFSADLIPYEMEISSDEVTAEQFLRFDPSYSHQAELTSMDPRIPAGVITWEMAIDYCRWLTIQDGMTDADFPYERDSEGASVLRHDFDKLCGYRLPTAREWVAVWDADPARTACVQDDSLVNNYARLAPFSKNAAEAVGGEKPDCNGIFHLATNAEEWCSDRLNQYRAMRGIYYGWGLGQRDKIAAQHWVHGQLNYVRCGFRVARSTGRSESDSE